MKLSSNHRRELIRTGPPRNTVGISGGWRDRKLLRESWVTVSSNDLSRGLYAIGATGTGKTTFLMQILAHDIQRQHSTVLFDHRGDLANGLVELAAGRVHPENFALLDLRDKDRPLGLNPLIGSGEFYIRALGVLDAIEVESSTWGVQLEETLRNALLALATVGASLVDLDSLLHNARCRRVVIRGLTNERLRSYWERFDMLSPERQALLASPVLNKLSALLSVDTIRAVLGHPDPIDLTAHLSTRGSIFATSLAVDQMHSSGRTLGRMVLASISRELFARTELPESERNPVRLVLDEFEVFQDQMIEDILAQGRKYGYPCLLAHQTLAQISPRMRALIFGNVGMIAAFRVSRDDGAVLSKHMTGDAKAIDFTSLPTGHCVLWKVGHEPVMVECNAPLIKEFGRVSPAARAFRQRLRDLIPQREVPAPTEEAGSTEPPPSLEDWI